MRRTGAAVARFLREARVTGQLEHPGIVPVYEVGKRSDGTLYYTMKLVRGKTLAEKLAECKTLPDRLKLLPHFLDLCNAIAYAHSKGIIHRDIKPQNIMIGEFGETVVLDWGLAKVRGMADEKAREIEKEAEILKEAKDGETVYGKPIGTPAYMSPEQADGRIDEIDERSDVWSLGAVLYQILTGRPPFEGVNPYEIVGKVIKEPVIPVKDYESDAPPELCAVSEKSLRKSRSERYQETNDLAEDITRFQTGGIVSAYDYSVIFMVKRLVKNHWQVAATGAISVLVLIVLTYWATLQVQGARKQQKEIERKANEYLSVAYYQYGLVAEKEKRWNEALLYFANAYVINDHFKISSGEPGVYEAIQRVYLAENEEFDPVIFKAHSNKITSISIEPKGNFYLTSSFDGTLKLWLSISDKLIRTFKGHKYGVLSVYPTNNWKYAVSRDLGGVVKIWSLGTGKCLYTYHSSDKQAVLIHTPPHGDLFFLTENKQKTGTSSTIYSISQETGKLGNQTTSALSISDISYSDASGVLALLTTTGELYFWEPKNTWSTSLEELTDKSGRSFNSNNP